MAKYYYGNRISIEIDAEDILDQIPDDDILAYVEENNLIDKEINANDEPELVSLIEYVMNKRYTVIPRTKEELKKYICETIDYWHKS